MNPSTCSEVLSEAAQGTEHAGTPRADTVLQDLCSKEQISPRASVGPYVPGECGVDTFVDGAGI